MKKQSITIAVLVVVLCMMLTTVFCAVFLRQSSGQTPADDTTKTKSSASKVSISWKDQPFICYVSGIEGTKVLQEKSTRYSDVNLLAVVNPLSHEIFLLNTPRDTLLSVPDVAGADESEVGEPEKLDAMPLYGKKSVAKSLGGVVWDFHRLLYPGKLYGIKGCGRCLGRRHSIFRVGF
jgi:anionic cell wall polymer biosynthesis LytR-Cps2A-Psr (LCP) family protein